MKVFFHKIFTIAMAFLLLLSTVSWTVDRHFCMGRVMDVALFTKAQDCGMKMAMTIMEDSLMENHCCDSETSFIPGQDDLKLSFNDIRLDQQLFLVVFTNTYLHLFDSVEIASLSDEYYPPPLLVKDIQLLDAVFLI